MEPVHVFSERERRVLGAVLGKIPESPYTDYPGFRNSIAELVMSGSYPPSVRDVCDRVCEERNAGIARAHVLRNCPVDEKLPAPSTDDLRSVKYVTKTTFISEAFVAFVAELSGSPMMAYSATNEGRFFDDVVAIGHYRGTQSAFSDRDLVFHNDRSAHWVRPDLVALLALRSPEDEITYTTYVDGTDLLRLIPTDHRDTLRQAHFITDFSSAGVAYDAQPHPIVVGRSIRYVDTVTSVVPTAPVVARDALIALKNALALVEKRRHRLVTGDLLIFENQEGLHCREKMEVRPHDHTRTRWLLKTYFFRHSAAADAYADKWYHGIPGLIAE